MVDLSHLSESSQKRIRAEMSAGKKRLKEHAPAIAAAQASLEEQARRTGQELNVTGQDIIAQQAARERAEKARMEEEAEAQREEALLRHREKEVADQIEGVLGRKGFAVTEDVVDEAQRVGEMKTEAAEQEPQRVNQELGVTGTEGGGTPEAAQEADEAREAATEAQNQKEAADRQEVGLYVEDESNPNFGGYDDNGDPIWKNDPFLRERDNAQQGAESDTVDARVVVGEAAADAEPKARGRGRPKASPANAVGTGPKSE